MLRTVHIKNYVKFKDYQDLDFSGDGPFIFIGENASGKSSVFEGIRRCLKLECSTSISTVPDRNIPSYFICGFDTKSRSVENEKIVSGIVSIPVGDQEKNIDGMHYYKFALRGQNSPIFINRIGKSENEGLTVSKRYKASECDRERERFIKTIMKERTERSADEESNGDEHIQTYIKMIFESKDECQEANDELKSVLDELTSYADSPQRVGFTLGFY